MKSKFSNRSMFSLLAKMRRGGPMRDKRLKRADENKHQDYLEEDFDEEYNLFDDAKKIAQIKKEKDNSDEESARQELSLMRSALLTELNKIDQKMSIKGQLTIVSSTKESYVSITLCIGNHKVCSFLEKISQDSAGTGIKPHIWAHLYESDDYYDCTVYVKSLKDMPKLFKEVAHHLAKWI